MCPVEAAFWEQVVAQGHVVPPEPSLAELTAELTAMLGAVDPIARDQTACPTLAAWIAAGVYDELLVGLGDGMALGLEVGLGEQDADSVFRRSFSVLVLAACCSC